MKEGEYDMVKKYVILLIPLMLLISGCGQAYDQGADEVAPERNTRDRLGMNDDQLNTNNDRFGTLGQTERRQLTDEKQPQDEFLTIFSGLDRLDQVKSYQMNGHTYVPLNQVLQLLNFNVKEEGSIVQAGFTDVFIEVTQNSDQAVIEGEKTTLSSPVISVDNQTLISIADLSKVFGADADVQSDNDRLTITIPAENEDYGFPENVNLDELPVDQEQPEDVPAMSATKAGQINRTARKYIGVPYLFGSPSGYTKTFDCSSFTQYVYGLNGIDLPRISRHQAKLGEYVPVKDLRAGDLLFFYWPGRFKSNKIVGHVGIYMGSGYMIHSVPRTAYSTDGVQITKISDPDNGFRKFYLGAKRIGG
jgi:cell wall-associated NlpC family hydrolase